MCNRYVLATVAELELLARELGFYRAPYPGPLAPAAALQPVPVATAAALAPAPGAPAPNGEPDEPDWRGWPPSWNIALTDPAPVFTRTGPALARFGFPGPQGRPHGNARDDQLAGHWRRLLAGGAGGGRCLVPASGWYEWDSDKQPWYFSCPARSLVCFAGLHDGERFAIVTTPASADCAVVHDRMPAVLDAAGARRWLATADGAEALALAVPLADGLVQRHRVGRSIGNVRSAGPQLIAPLADAGAQPGLFGP